MNKYEIDTLEVFLYKIIILFRCKTGFAQINQDMYILENGTTLFT